MYRIKEYIRKIKNLIRWAPIIWKDRDWDYYFIYEILKHKLTFTEKYIREKGIHMYNTEDADSILKSIDLIDKVQTEYHLDKYLSEATEWNREGIDKAVEDHDKVKQELFQHLNDNIEKWWD
jgi:uncharacterized protein YbcV (DUF1398 family)